MTQCIVFTMLLTNVIGRSGFLHWWLIKSGQQKSTYTRLGTWRSPTRPFWIRTWLFNWRQWSRCTMESSIVDEVHAKFKKKDVLRSERIIPNFVSTHLNHSSTTILRSKLTLASEQLSKESSRQSLLQNMDIRCNSFIYVARWLTTNGYMFINLNFRNGQGTTMIEYTGKCVMYKNVHCWLRLPLQLLGHKSKTPHIDFCEISGLYISDENVPST